MNDVELKMLEMLIDKLHCEVGIDKCRAVCVLNNHITDGFYVGVYDLKGEIDNDRSFGGASLRDVLNKIKLASTTKQEAE